MKTWIHTNYRPAGGAPVTFDPALLIVTPTWLLTNNSTRCEVGVRLAIQNTSTYDFFLAGIRYNRAGVSVTSSPTASIGPTGANWAPTVPLANSFSTAYRVPAGTTRYWGGSMTTSPGAYVRLIEVGPLAGSGTYTGHADATLTVEKLVGVALTAEAWAQALASDAPTLPSSLELLPVSEKTINDSYILNADFVIDFEVD